MTSFNVYCDESGHLEHDKQDIMVLGAVWCPLELSKSIFERIRDIKERHELSGHFEVKWTKVSPAKIKFYLDLVDYFFDNDDLHFRALIAEKSGLVHESYGQSHDEWYYKMYFDMLKVILKPDAQFNIYLDIKDTRGAKKVERLHDVLCNNIWDFSRSIIEKVQLVRSDEVELIQLADLLIGAISYKNRGLNRSEAKLNLIHRIQERSSYSLERTTLYREEKMNLFKWRAGRSSLQ
mgnify:CR=1 FL=1